MRKVAMNQSLQWRYATKKFDNQKEVAQVETQRAKEALQNQESLKSEYQKIVMENEKLKIAIATLQTKPTPRKFVATPKPIPKLLPSTKKPASVSSKSLKVADAPKKKKKNKIIQISFDDSRN